MIGLRVALVAITAAGLIAVGCGDDDSDASSDEPTTAAVPGADEAAAVQEEIADLSDEEQIARIGEEWADPFAAGDEAMCAYLHPDLGGASSCIGHAAGDLTGSTKLQQSFDGATVESVDVTGESAVASFSNGEQVTFSQDPDGAWLISETPRVGASG